MKRNTAPDANFFHSDYNINIKIGTEKNPIGRCHHNILSRELDL